MKMTQTAIKRGVTFAMIYLIAIGFGIFSLMRLNIDLYPKLEFPILAIITQYTGVGPYDLETVVTRPIEETVSSVENIKTVSSTSQQGMSLVMLEFNWGTDMDQAETDVRRNLEFIRDVMPPDASEPMVFAFDPSSQPVLYLTLSSDFHGPAELRRIGERDMEPRLERIHGVASAFTMGGLRREIRVLVDPVRMRAHNVSMQQITGALQANNLQIPSGYIDNNKLEFSIRTSGEYTSIDQIANTSVAVYGGTVIHIKDVARVEDGFRDQRQEVWNNNQPAVMVMVMRQSDANTVTVCRDVNSRLKEIESELPRGVKIGTMMDLSVFITNSMSNLGDTAWQAILLTVLVLLFFLRNVRSSLIVAVSIPVSVITTFAVMNQAGLTLNIISMAGLALAIGMLVDNSIVVLEVIFRHHENGENLIDASNNGANEVAMAVTASTLTTLAVFVPVLFVPGLAGQLFRDMVITICFSLTISLIVALTLIPLMTSRLLRLKKSHKADGLAVRSNRLVTGWLEDLRLFYRRTISWSMDHKKTVLGITFGLFVLSLIILFSLGGEFLPHTDQGFIAISVDRSPGVSLEAMKGSMHQVNDILMENVPEAENIYTAFGQGEGVMALFSSQTSAEGDISIRLKRLSERKRSMFEIQDSLRGKFAKLADVDVRFQDRGEAMFSGGGDIVLKIFGHDLARSEAISKQLEASVKKIAGVASVESSVRESVPELQINLDRQRIADLGLSTAQVGQVVSTSILGTTVTRFRDQGDEFEVKVQLDKRSRTSKEDLENILIMSPTGAQVPLRAIANIEYSKAPKEILREDQERIVTLTIDVSGRDTRRVTSDVQKALRQVPLPPDYRIEIGGAAKDQQESFMYLGLALIVAMLLVYGVMASQFESLVDPFIIMFTIPLQFIGVAFALLITGTDMNVMALVGVVMLVGIVVNNGIVLVDYINLLRKEGRGLVEAIKEAGETRLRPVLMTALTTILGMLPLALGLGESGETWAPMARSVMGGLTVATALTLVVVPIIYYYMERLGEFFKGKRLARVQRRLQRGKLIEDV